MIFRIILKLFLLTSIILCVNGQRCTNGSIIQLRAHTIIKDTYPIDNSAFDCMYRCHPSIEANGVIEMIGIETKFVLEFCTYYGTCQVSCSIMAI